MIDYDLFTQHYHIDINTELLQKHKVHYLHCNNDLYQKYLVLLLLLLQK